MHANRIFWGAMSFHFVFFLNQCGSSWEAMGIAMCSFFGWWRVGGWGGDPFGGGMGSRGKRPMAAHEGNNKKKGAM